MPIIGCAILLPKVPASNWQPGMKLDKMKNHFAKSRTLPALLPGELCVPVRDELFTNP
jgi:hypothetical protein